MESDARWESTLMGAAFWRAQEKNNTFDANHHGHYSANLQKHIMEHHTLRGRRLSDVSAGQAAAGHGDNKENMNMIANKPFTKQRRSSMSDVGSSKAGFLGAASKKHFWDFSKKAAEDPDITNKGHVRTGRSLIRSTFGSSGLRSRSVQHGDSMFDFGFQPHPGSEENPLLYFRGGVSWKYMERHLDVLCLDLFWPIKERASLDNDMIRVEELRPLSTFRNLRVLKITGMMQSYQTMIWQAVWLNTELEELDLEMALEPCIRRNFNGDWPVISANWKMMEKVDDQPVYYGDGDGTLQHNIGIGEYLDKTVIESAKLCASMMGPTRNRLSIVIFRLAGFVVDGDPFYLWFDPYRLRRIQFKHDCVDAGFYLPETMKGTVEVIFPKKAATNVAQVGRVVNVAKELKVIQLSKGKKISEAPYRPQCGDHKKCNHHHHNDKIPTVISARPQNKENKNCSCETTSDGDFGSESIETGLQDMTIGGGEGDSSSQKKKGPELSGSKFTPQPRPGQTSMSASPRRRRMGGLLHGRRAIPRGAGKPSKTNKSKE